MGKGRSNKNCSRHGAERHLQDEEEGEVGKLDGID